MKSTNQRPQTWTRSSIMSMLGKTNLINSDSPVLCEMEAHKRDVLTPEPVILKPTVLKREYESMEDVTNFPR